MSIWPESSLQRPQERDEIRLLLVREPQTESHVVEVDRIEQRRRRPVVKVRRAPGEPTQHRPLESADVLPFPRDERTARVRHDLGFEWFRLVSQGVDRHIPHGKPEAIVDTIATIVDGYGGLGDADIEWRRHGVVARGGCVVARRAGADDGNIDVSRLGEVVVDAGYAHDRDWKRIEQGLAARDGDARGVASTPGDSGPRIVLAEDDGIERQALPRTVGTVRIATERIVHSEHE